MKKILSNIIVFFILINPFARALNLEVKEKKIAIITPVSHPSLDKMKDSFIRTLNNKKSRFFKYKFRIFNGNGNLILLKSQINEVVSSNFDLIFTLGARASKLTKEVMEKNIKSKRNKGERTPIVFTAVNDPVKLGIIDSLDSRKSKVTGVSERIDYKIQIQLLKYIKPDMKKILLVYNPTQGAGLEKDKVKVENILKGLKIKLKSMEIYNINEIYSKVNSIIRDYDAVLILKDNTVVRGIDSLVKLCNKYRKILISSDLDSVEKGAVVGFGVLEEDFGIKGGELALKILEDGVDPSKIPISNLENYRFKVNKDELKKQGLDIKKELLFFMESSEIYSKK